MWDAQSNDVFTETRNYDRRGIRLHGFRVSRGTGCPIAYHSLPRPISPLLFDDAALGVETRAGHLLFDSITNVALAWPAFSFQRHQIGCSCRKTFTVHHSTLAVDPRQASTFRWHHIRCSDAAPSHFQRSQIDCSSPN